MIPAMSAGLIVTLIGEGVVTDSNSSHPILLAVIGLAGVVLTGFFTLAGPTLNERRIARKTGRPVAKPQTTAGLRKELVTVKRANAKLVADLADVQDDLATANELLRAERAITLELRQSRSATRRAARKEPQP